MVRRRWIVVAGLALGCAAPGANAPAPVPAQALVLFAVAWVLRQAASAEAVPFVYFEF